MMGGWLPPETPARASAIAPRGRPAENRENNEGQDPDRPEEWGPSVDEIDWTGFDEALAELDIDSASDAK